MTYFEFYNLINKRQLLLLLFLILFIHSVELSVKVINIIIMTKEMANGKKL